MNGLCKAIARAFLAYISVASSANASPNITNYGSFVFSDGAPEVLFLVGEIQDGDFFALRQAMRSHEIKLLVTSSLGGSVNEALQIATAVHDNGIATYVPKDGTCASACAFVFFGGTEREAVGALGVHQFFAGGSEGDGAVSLDTGLRAAQFTAAEIIGFLNEYDTPPFVYELMFSTEGMHFFSQQEIERVSIVKNDPKIHSLAETVEMIFASLIGSSSTGKDQIATSMPETPTPKPTPTPTPTPSLEERALSFLLSMNEVWSQPNPQALTYISEFYASDVNFYGNLKSQQDVLFEKRKFAERWPLRNYYVEPSSVEVNCNQNSCNVYSVIHWDASSPARKAHSAGRSTWNLTLVATAGVFRITDENGEVISRE